MGAVLNTLHHFFMPAFAPVVMNICWILGAVLAPYTGKTLEKMIYAVAIATFLSGLFSGDHSFPGLTEKRIILSTRSKIFRSWLEVGVDSHGSRCLWASRRSNQRFD